MTIEQRAKQVWDYFIKKGWTKQAIAGILGNMEAESHITPDLHQYGGGSGYGLVQWTPGSKLKNWAYEQKLDPADMYTQLKRIDFEVEEELEFRWPDMLFKDYIKSTRSPEYLAEIFLRAYERAGVARLDVRTASARKWYNYFTSNQPDVPTPPDNGNQYYTVVAGDSLWGISRKFGLTLDQLCAMNNITPSTVIHPGDRLIVKKGTKPAPKPKPQPQPNPTPSPDKEIVSRSYKESGRFTANQRLAIRNKPNSNSQVAAWLEKGESVNYDTVYLTNKFVYISYISYSGIRRYIAIRTYVNGKRGPLYGTII